jgi:hypothetical protein
MQGVLATAAEIASNPRPPAKTGNIERKKNNSAAAVPRGSSTSDRPFILGRPETADVERINIGGKPVSVERHPL